MGCCDSEAGEQEPTRSKRCTDVCWFIIFIAFFVLLIIIAAFAFVYGNPLRIINGYDSFGNTCGVKHNEKLSQFPLSGIDTSDKRYLIFFDVKHLRKSLKMCVKMCPTRELQTMDDIRSFYRETGTNVCQYGYDLGGNTPSGPSNQFCPTLPVLESTPVLHRCFPKNVKKVAKEVVTKFYSFINNWDTVEQVLTDLYSSWKEMIIFSFVALGLSLIMVFVLHWLAALVSWIFMILVSISSIIGTCLLWYTYYEIRNGLRETPENMVLLESLHNEKAFLWYSIIATIITVILLLLVFVMRSRVSFLSKLFKETASCLASIPGLFLQPLITFVFLVIYFAFWLSVVVCLATANFPSVQDPPPSATSSPGWTFTTSTTTTTIAPALGKNGTSPSFKTYALELIDFDGDSWVKGMWWVYIIGLIWVSEFILACQQMTIAGAVTHWYFRREEASDTPVLHSIEKLIKYHIGSVAKGSFLITIFKVPRLILTYIFARLKSSSDQGSETAKCCLKCGVCCLYCLENFIRYLNHNAYTIIAIEGVHFCKAASTAFGTLASNALQMITVNSVGDFILFLGKCIVTAITGSLGLIALKRNSELHFYAAPTLLICVFSFFIAHCILSLYEMVVDTLFICVCEDRKLNGGEGRWNHTALAQLAKEPNQDQTATEMKNLKTEDFRNEL